MELPREPFWVRIKRFCKTYWLLLFFVAIITTMLGYMLIDFSNPSAGVIEHQRDMKDIAVSDAYVDGWKDGRQTRPLATVTLKPGSDGSFTGTVDVAGGGAGTGTASGAALVPEIYRGAWAEVWATAWGILQWVLGLLVMMIGINLLARMMIGAPEPGAPRLAIMRLFNRAADQSKGAGPAAKGKEEGLTKITIIKPADNEYRLKDFVGDQEVMAELVPFIEAVKAQRIDYERLIAEAVKEQEARKKNKSAVPNALKDSAWVVVIPPIPMGRYGGVQGTKYIVDGPPGTGKTLFATIAAGEAGVTLISVAGTLENIFIGAGAKNVRELERVAAEHAPCIIFIDEGEEAGKQRTKDAGNGGANSDGSTTALLAAIDGVASKVGQANGIHWVLATNYFDKVDEALKRSGRLKSVKFTVPSLETLKELLKLFFAKLKVPLRPDFEPTAVANILLGKTGADIAELSNIFAIHAEEIAKDLEKRLKAAGKSGEQVEESLNELTFGHAEFIEAVLRLLMGRKRKASKDETFQVVLDTALHEGLHALSNALMEWMKLLNWRVRFLTVADRQRSKGMMYASPDADEGLVSIANVLGRIVTAYAGAMGQLVGHDDRVRWGSEIDLYRDSGASSDNNQAASLVHQSIIQFGGSLRLGPISKGKSGHTWFTEMGPKLVDDIDREVQTRQKLGQFLAWRITSILMQNETTWVLFDEVLNSPDRTVLQARFYELFDRIISDRRTRKQVLALPGQYNRLASNADSALNWVPTRQGWLERLYIRKKIAWLKARYVALKQKREAEVELIEATAVTIAETSVEAISGVESVPAAQETPVVETIPTSASGAAVPGV